MVLHTEMFMTKLKSIDQKQAWFIQSDGGGNA